LLWIVALAIDYLGPVVIGIGRGWRVAPEHFAERHGLIILIALGESLIAIGLGAGFELDTGVLVAAALGIVVVSALWWLYFDVAAIFARRRFVQTTGLDLARFALHSLQLPPPADDRWHRPLCPRPQDDSRRRRRAARHGACGRALRRCRPISPRAHRLSFRTTGRIFRRRTVGAVVLLALTPVAVAIAALAALALVSAVCAVVVAWEVLRYREDRIRVRHPDLAA
jgi:Bacterial low temperature requirement A protein (LtrA)